MIQYDVLSSRKIIPKRDLKAETQASANGECITRPMTEEEREKYFGHVKPVKDRDGRVMTKPIIQKVRSGNHGKIITNQ